ncbi:MAG: aldehyde ferredoxin oxidoreductase family protein [Candidatus Bathyarchaeia archaeon]
MVEKGSYGYAGKILWLNLDKLKAHEEMLDQSLTRAYIGGTSLAAKLLYEKISKKLDPFSNENPLLFMTGPLTGTPIPFSGKWSVSSISPLTGIWGESNAGGIFGAKLKLSGYDGIVIEGKSNSPIYVFINSGKVFLKDASHIWGLTTSQTNAFLKEELGFEVSSISIGPAGENLVKISSIVGDCGDVAARCGLGALMGFKKVKAIAVEGNEAFEIFNPEKLLEFYEWFKKERLKDIGLVKLSNYGTSGWFEPLVELGDTPIKYWKGSGWLECAKRLSAKRIIETLFVGKAACFFCPVGCGRILRRTGDLIDSKVSAISHGLEYETLASLGSLCLNDDLKTLALANELCNEYGLDTISTGSVIAFAMECNENGLIPKEFLNELEISWGNSETIISLIEMIAKRKGLGNVLANGVKEASLSFNEKAIKLAAHVKGLEVPMHDPRSTPGFALLYATSNLGASHCRGLVKVLEALQSPIEVVNKVVSGENIAELLDSLILCRFSFIMNSYSLEDSLNLYKLVTGNEVSKEEFLRIGERSFNLKRLINFKQGIEAYEDRLPEILLNIPRVIQSRKAFIEDFDSLIKEFYKFRGWDGKGFPKKDKLRELGLN